MKLKDLNFVYNAAAHFHAAEKYPDGLIEALKKPGIESFEALCWAAAEMALQGELVRRHMGETPRVAPTAEDFMVSIRPNQISKISEIVFTELANGLGSRDDDEEIDLVLCEIQKKTSQN